MKTAYIVISIVVLVLAVAAGVFFFGGSYFQEPPQICYLTPLEKTSIDLYYDCEDFDTDTVLKLPDIDHDKLVTLSIELINEDRERYNSPVLELGESPTAQEHAEELLNTCRTSYWSSNGMKPYMRYSASGGDGAINENVRVIGTPEIQKFWTEESIEQIIAWNQYSMVERDEANEFRHSANILHPDHNYVNIGIAWSNFCVAIVHQFEDKYVEWSQPPIITLNHEFMLAGRINFNSTIEEIHVFYDPIPMPLSDREFMLSPRIYGFGHVCSHLQCSDGSLPIAIVLPNTEDAELGPEVLESILNQESNIPLLVAHKWEMTHGEDFTTFSIEEDFSKLMNLSGKGVYTVLVFAEHPDGSDTGMVLTTISIFFL